MSVESFIVNSWTGHSTNKALELYNSINGESVGYIDQKALPYTDIFQFAKNTGSRNLRKMTFHERARMLKALALYLTEKKDQFYQVSWATGATKVDSWIDIEGGNRKLICLCEQGTKRAT